MAARFTLASGITSRLEAFSAYISTFSKRSLSLLLLFTVTISVCFLFSSNSPNFLSTTPDGFRFAHNETHLLSLGKYDCASCKQPNIKGLDRKQIWEACLDPGVVPEYYLTIVLVARARDNDQYHRIQNAIDSAYLMAEKTKTLTELLLIEWNPQAGRRHLREMYRYRRSEFLTYRIITIPHWVHQLLQGSSDVLEYEARNVGIRFARGEYIVTTNSENLWSQNMHNAIVSRSWRKRVFYTQNSQTANVVLEKFATDQQIIDACPHNSFELESFSLPSSAELKMDNYESLTKDSKDFILAHRDTWRMVRGFRESRAQTWMDTELLLTAAWTLDIPITHTQETLTCRQQDSPASQSVREEDRRGVNLEKMMSKQEKHMNAKDQWALQHLDIWKHDVQCEVFRGGLGV